SEGRRRLRQEPGSECGCTTDTLAPKGAVDFSTGIERGNAQSDIAEMIIGALRHNPAVRTAYGQDGAIGRLAFDARDGPGKKPGVAALDDVLLARFEYDACSCHMF